MASTTHLLFRAKHGWDISQNLPAFATRLSKRCKDPSGIYQPLNQTSYSTLNADITRAIYHYIGHRGVYGTYEFGDFAIVKVSDSQYAAERSLADGTKEVVVWNTNGDIKAAIVEMTGRYTPFPTYGGKDDTIDSTTIFLALLPYMTEVMTEENDLLDRMANNPSAVSEFDLYYLSDAMYQLIKAGQIKVNIPQDGNIDLLPKTTVNSGAFNGICIKGQPDLLLGGKKQRKSRVLTMKEAKKEFESFANTHSWTDEEKELIPTFPDDFPVPAESVKMAKKYLSTKEDIRPMVNFMWRGITSYGKSTGVEVMAALLDMPLLRMTCHSNMETQQFLSDFVPDTSEVKTNNLPNFETIMYSPEQAYFQLTGTENENATPQMCLEAYGEAVAKQNSSTPRFKHVVSNYVKALINGYIIEVQEVSRIKDSGVLVGLNEYDRPNAVIPLIDGSYARRNPNSIVVFTDNVGYVSCRPIDPSVIRRMSFIIDSYELPKDKVIERIKYNTQYNDKQVIEGCYNIWLDIQTYCHEHDINEGSMSVSELEMLIQSIKYDGIDSIRENIVDCIISKATSDIAEHKELVNVMEINLPKYFN